MVRMPVFRSLGALVLLSVLAIVSCSDAHEDPAATPDAGTDATKPLAQRNSS